MSSEHEKLKSILEGVGGQLATIIKNYGCMVIQAYPDLDSVLAASILYEALARNRVECVINFSLLPDDSFDVPVAYLGYPVEVVEDLKPRYGAVLFARGEQPKGLTRFPLVASRDTSVAGLVASALSELMVVSELGIPAIIAGYWRGLDSGKRAEFRGLEVQLVEVLETENKIVGQLTIRLFGWFMRPAEEAIAETIAPFIPGLSCEYEKVKGFLESDPRLRKVLGRTVNELDQDLLALLAEKLYEKLKAESRVMRRPSELIGYAYYSEVSPLKDLREATYILYTFLECAGPHYLAPFASTPLQVAAAAKLAYNRLKQELCEQIEKWHTTKPREESIGRLKIARVGETEAPLAILEKQLRLLGDISSSAILAVESGEGLLASAETLVEIGGYVWLRDSIKSGCVEPIDGVLVKLNTAKCSW